MTEAKLGELVLRPATSADLPGILDVLMASLGWTDRDLLTSFLDWKHEQSSFGRSLAWVAESDGEIVGYRTFLRWRFLVDGEPVTAVRAVDTATRPDQQRRGIFSRLTMAAVDQALGEGTGFVFNTPNTKSGPGYLKLGWVVVGLVPIAIRPGGPVSVIRGSRRDPIERLSQPSTEGDPAAAVLADSALESLVASQPRLAGVVTDRTVEHLRWRVAFEPLHYRAVTGPGGVADGVAVFRIRRRGSLRVAMISEVIAPDGDRGAAARLLRRAARVSRTDAAVCGPASLPPGAAWRGGYTTVPRRGPRLVFRALVRGDPPPLDAWKLSVGDVELF